MNHLLSQRNPEVSPKPNEIPGKDNTPRPPETHPPGDTPITPTDPGKQPIDNA